MIARDARLEEAPQIADRAPAMGFARMAGVGELVLSDAGISDYSDLVPRDSAGSRFASLFPPLRTGELGALSEQSRGEA